MSPHRVIISLIERSPLVWYGELVQSFPSASPASLFIRCGFVKLDIVLRLALALRAGVIHGNARRLVFGSVELDGRFVHPVGKADKLCLPLSFVYTLRSSFWKRPIAYAA